MPKAIKPAKRRGCWFDEKAANRVIEFFEVHLVHSKGEWAGRPFKLEPWQKELLSTAFGWKTAEGLRRYQRIYVEIPRKNGKSTLAAGIGLYLTTADFEDGAEVYSAAADRSQAAIVFDEARRMAASSPAIAGLVTTFKKSIYVASTASGYQAISAEANTKHGFNAHGVIFDELHAQPNRELYDVLSTSMVARREPMFWTFTTAGHDRNSICWELHEHAQRVLAGEVIDPTFLPVLYAADPKDDWHSPKVWKKANPNLGVSIKMEAMKAQHLEAVQLPRKENTFKRLHLNIWTEQDVRWMPIEEWDACTTPMPTDLVGKPCWIGMDLSSRRDITAVVSVFKVGSAFAVLPEFFVPADDLEHRERADRVPYREWIRDGFMKSTPGNVIDYSFIRNSIDQSARTYEVREVAYDPWGANQLAIELQDHGLTCVEFRQGFQSMSEPMKKLEELILTRMIIHGANPVLRWMMGNVAVQEDAAGNIKPTKKKSAGRIDGVVAKIMGLGRAIVAKDDTSPYETRGIMVL